MFLNNRNSQSGQVLLIVVLVMVVSLTIGLSVISRSITNVRTSTEEANSAQALAAAEAGIQKSLNSQGNSSGSFAVGGSGYNSDFNAVANPSTVDNKALNNGGIVTMNEGIDLWLVPHDASGNPQYTSQWNGTLNIYWGTGPAPSASECAKDAALEINIYRSFVAGDLGDIRAVKSVVDPCGGTREGISNSFPSPDSVTHPIGSETFRFRHVLSNITNAMIVRIIPLYQNAIIGVSKEAGATAFPSQGLVLDSTGSSGEVKRKINVFQGYSFVPVEFASYGILRPSNE